MFDTSIVIYPRPSLPEALLQADIKFNDDTIRIFTSHLQSVQFKKRDYERINDIRNYEDSIVSNSKTIFSKIRKSITNRSLQVGIIKQHLKQSPHP
jgi:hypothetical protein